MAMLGLTMSFFAFKDAEKRATSGWYEVQINPSDPNNEASQQILELQGTPPVSDPDGCAQLNMGDRCAIHLDFASAATPKPTTVAAARSASGVTVGDDANQPL